MEGSEDKTGEPKQVIRETDSEAIRQSRKMALELMLSNHYADCLGP